MVHFTLPGRRVDLELNLNPACLFKDQRGFLHLAFGQRAGQAHEHDVIAALFQADRFPRRDLDEIDTGHRAHPICVNLAFMHARLHRKAGFDADQPF